MIVTAPNRRPGPDIAIPTDMTRKKSVAALGRAPQDEFEQERTEPTESFCPRTQPFLPEKSFSPRMIPDSHGF